MKSLVSRLIPAALRAVPVALAAGGASAPAQAQTPATAFTATAVQEMPDGSAQTGWIAKSGRNMRLELEVDGKRSIQIMRGDEGRAYLVDPQQEIFAVVEDPSIATAVDGADSPCPPPAQMQAAQITCKVVGQGEVSGIVTQRYQIRVPGTQGATLVEWDPGRRRALAETWPDGTKLRLTFREMQEIGGRNVEYWSTVLERPGQPPVLGGWWFDPELRVVVREEIPGGIRRELRDIKVGPVDPALFEPPAGYTQVRPQALAPQAGQGGQGGQGGQ